MRVIKHLGVYCFVAFSFGGLAHSLNAAVNVLTHHNDNSRTGQNTSETALTPANVNSTYFGKLISVALDGAVYAQPLIVTGVSIPSQGTHDVAYVVTQNDSLYAIDANNGTVLWQVSFINSSNGVTPVPGGDFPCDDISPNVGIVSTPVIDPKSGTIYLVARTKENGSYFQRLHAVDIASHAEKFGGPIVINASVKGTGDGNSNGTITFDPLHNNQRSALLLENGHVIIAWASSCDWSPYHGWLMSYNASTLAQEAALNFSPNGNAAGIWMGGAGPAADAQDTIYFATGNGDYDGKSNFGDSVLKVTGPSSGHFTISDWFTPYNQSTMNSNDYDLGAGGVLLLPSLPSGSAHQNLAVAAGKTDTIYLLDRSNMGKYCSSCTSKDTQVVQEISGAIGSQRSMPAYWNGYVYFGANHDYLKGFSFNANNSGLLSSTSVFESDQTFSGEGATPSISANGTENGILWALDNSSNTSSCCQVLHAYNATNLALQIYTSNDAPNSRDVPGGAVKFTTPTIANGKVYVGSKTAFSIYGLLPAAATPTISPASGTYSSVQSVTISDASSGATIYYTTDGSTPTTSSNVYSGPINTPAASTTTIKAMASGGEFSPGPVVSATYTITAATSPTFNPAPGLYHAPVSVTMSDSTSGTTIYYTTNGSTPTTSSTVYTKAISFHTATYLKAIASGGSYTPSAVTAGHYYFSGAVPTFSPAAGTYSSSQSVTLSDTTSGVTIYYTTDGSTPTTSSKVYTAPIPVSSTTTIKAVAAGNGYAAGGVGSATYTIK